MLCSCVWYWLGEWETYTRGVTYGWIPTLGNHTETPVHFIMKSSAAVATAFASSNVTAGAAAASNASWSSLASVRSGAAGVVEHASRATSAAEKQMTEAMQRGDKAWGGPEKRMSYLTAMYFTLSCMTSVGFGNVSANTEFEKVFVIVLMTLGGALRCSAPSTASPSSFSLSFVSSRCGVIL